MAGAKRRLDGDSPNRRAQGVAISLVLAAVLVIGGGLLYDQQRRSQSATAAADATPATIDPSTFRGGGDRPTFVAPPDPRVLFLGDSLTDGTAATNKQVFGFAPRLAALEGWSDYRVDGVGLSGFLAPGISEEAHRNYRDRLQQIYFTKTYNPNVIIFQGGVNDIKYPQADVQAKIIETFAVARKYWPDAQFALMGPVTTSGQMKPVNASYERAAYEARVPFIDALRRPIIATSDRELLISDDGWHPNDAGHAKIAEEMKTRLSEFAPDVDR